LNPSNDPVGTGDVSAREDHGPNVDHVEIQPEETKKIPSAYQGWVMWTRSQANKHLNSSETDEKIRAVYRLGQIEQDEGNNEASLVFFK
jgi:hypothetical protein